MKKLMIAAAIVCAAVASQAASASWTTGDTYYKGIGSELADGDGDYYNGKATLFFLTADQYATFEQGNAKAIYDNFKANDGSLKVTVGDVTSTITAKSVKNIEDGYASFGNLGDFSKGSYYGAIIMENLDDSTGELIAYSANTFGVEATDTALKGVADLSLAWGMKQAGDATVWQEYSTVPEPTSGLLLLLGVAGLALRRRRA